MDVVTSLCDSCSLQPVLQLIIYTPGVPADWPIDAAEQSADTPGARQLSFPTPPPPPSESGSKHAVSLLGVGFKGGNMM